jgi:hypothetical protein
MGYGNITVADLTSSGIWSPRGTYQPGLNAAYTRQESQKERMALQAEKQMRLQTQMMQSEFDKMKSKADTSGDLAAQFLTAWGGSINDIKSMYGDAASVLKSLISGESGGAIKPQLGGLKDLSDLMKQEYTSYKEQYAPLEKEFMMGAREMGSGKRNILRDLAEGGGKWVDTEGAAGRAKADVAIQGELQNQAEARKLMAMGIDPSSGRFGALTRKGAIDLAGETVRAMNLARQTEKTAGLARGTALANAMNPSEFANIGLGIRREGTDILKGAGAMEQARANVQSQYLQTMGNLGSSYANMVGGMARDITNPLAEMAGYYTGMSGGSTGNVNFGAINPMASYQAITQPPAVMQGSNELLGTKAAENKANKALTQADTLAAIRNQRQYGTAW